MRIKVIFLLFLTCLVFQANYLLAQVTSNGSAVYINVNSYKESTALNVFTYRIEVRGPNINHSNWSMFVRANPIITNAEGKVIDPSNISIRLNNVTGGPTIQSIGASTSPIPLSFNNQPIFQRSKYAIKHSNNDSYSQYIFTFDIIVKGGDYLKALKSEQDYQMALTFSTLRSNDELLTQALVPVRMRIYPTDAPPTEPTFGIQINSSARNGVLEFKTISDYVNGVSQTYQNGLSIVSNTPYAVQVKSLSSNLQSANNTLPVNTVNVNIKDPNNSAIGGTIALSETTQTVFNASNSGTQARLFDIRYFTKPNDARMLNSKPDSYQTTLTYTLIPQ